MIEGADGTRTTIGVYGGFIQVLNNQVTLITDRAEIAEGGREEAKIAERLAAEEESSDQADRPREVLDGLAKSFSDR